MDRALGFLQQTDAQFADTRVAMLRAEYLLEVNENLTYKTLRGTGDSVEDCKRAARVSPEYQTKFDEYLKTVREFEFLRPGANGRSWTSKRRVHWKLHGDKEEETYDLVTQTRTRHEDGARVHGIGALPGLSRV